MIRKAGRMKLYAGMEEEYERRHKAIWPELVAQIKENGGANYSIFLNRETNELFSYIEIEDEVRWSQRGSGLTKRWWDYMADIMETNPDNSPVFVPMDEVFHLD